MSDLVVYPVTAIDKLIFSKHATLESYIYRGIYKINSEIWFIYLYGDRCIYTIGYCEGGIKHDFNHTIINKINVSMKLALSILKVTITSLTKGTLSFGSEEMPTELNVEIINNMLFNNTSIRTTLVNYNITAFTIIPLIQETYLVAEQSCRDTKLESQQALINEKDAFKAQIKEREAKLEEREAKLEERKAKLEEERKSLDKKYTILRAKIENIIAALSTSE